MTGGTSLSVWMGGVTAELYSLLAAGTQHQAAPCEGSEPRTVAMYRALLDLTWFEPRVDVITGTSAGGLNGTFLAAAWRCWVPADEFMKLREMWLSLADLKELLRSPNESDPPSLLRGDEYFRSEIEKVLTEWRRRAGSWRQRAADDHDMIEGTAIPFRPEDLPDHPLDLLITITTVDAEARSRRDDYGETISDINHAHRLRFATSDISDYSSNAKWPTMLAVASRTSACIPGVFEPSFIPIGESDSKEAGLPDFSPHASFTRSHFAVDGGVVVNLPLREALERVFYQPADAPVRRVVLFVQPTPALKASTPATASKPPTIRASVGTVLSAPRAEGITEQVDRIRDHNRSVGRQADMRRSLYAVLGEDIESRAQDLMLTYRNQRTTASVHHTVGYIAKALEGHVVDRKEIEDVLFVPRRDLLPQYVIANGSSDEPHEWAWGIAPVEHAGSMVLGLIRSAPNVVQAELTVQWKQLTDALDEIREIRQLDRDHWTKQLVDLNTRIADITDDETISQVVADWAQSAYQSWPNGQGPTTLRRLRLAFTSIVSQLRSTASVLRSCDPEMLPATLLEDLDVLAPETTSRAGLAVRLRALHVVQTVLLDNVVAREQRVELQIASWNAKDHLTDRSPDSKLAGPELARLGAFLKRAWRANDWCWGRLDGASRLADLLLEPEHLREALTLPGRDITTAIVDFVSAEAFAFDSDERPAIEMLIRQTTGLAPIEPEADDPSSMTAFRTKMALYEAKTAKQAHTELTKIVGSRMQLAAVREELPEVAEAIRYSVKHEGSNELKGAEFLRVYEQMDGKADRASTVSLLRALQVGDESVGNELGYGLLNRTISRGGAVAVNALSSDTAGFSAVSKVLSPLRTPLHTLNSVVSTATSGSPFHRFLSTVAFAIGGALVGLRIAGVEVATPLLVAAEILLAGALAAALLRSGFWRQLPILLTITTLIGLTIVGEDIDQVLYDTTPQYAEADLPSGAVIDLGDGGRLTLTRTVGDEELDEELLLAEGLVRIDSNDAVVRRVDPEQRTAAWKERLFIEAAVLRWVLIGAAVLAILAIVRRYRRKSAMPSWSRRHTIATTAAVATLAAGSILLAVTDGFRSASRWALTGEPNGPWPKHFTSAAADSLGAYRVEVVVLAMIVVAVMLGVAYDLTLRRSVRWLRSKVRSHVVQRST